MTNGFAPWVVLAWFPIVLGLVKILGARRAAPWAILGAYLFLPPYAHWYFLEPLMFEKRTIAGPAFLLAAFILDGRTWLRSRPSWLDAPMIGFVVAPLIGLICHRFDEPGASLDQTWINLTEWAIPYAIGRVYLGEEDGPRRLAGAICLGGLAYVPICFYESMVGPKFYLSGLVYGTSYHAGGVERLGGYRPEGFLGHGLEVATWMALTTVLASWLWCSNSGWRPAGRATWWAGVIAAILGLTTILCRGVYGYGVLTLGLAATVITLGLRWKGFLVLLLLVPPAYMGTRSTHLWSGQPLLKVAQSAGREGTISVRFDSEDRFVHESVEQGIAFGAGGRVPYWTADGWWLVELKGGGLVGLTAMLAAFLFPAALVVLSPKKRFPPWSVEVGLALVVLLIMIHNLHNTSVNAALPLIGGALVSSYRLGNPRSERASTPLDRSPISPPLIATILVLAILEILGRLPRPPRIDLPESKAGAHP